MQLHQFLRYIHTGTGILLFDIQGVEILRVRDKDQIPVDLYEYNVTDITLGCFDQPGQRYCLYIGLEK